MLRFPHILLIGLLISIILLSACKPFPAIDPDKIPTPGQNDCPGLESQLLQIYQSENPVLAAEQMGFTVKDDKIQVLFILANNETAFLLKYDVELGFQTGDQVQGYAPLNKLCELVNLEDVLAIRRVSQPILD